MPTDKPLLNIIRHSSPCFSSRLSISPSKVPEAAAEMGMPYRSYRRYENGESEPTLSPLRKLAVYYGVTIDFLAGLKDEK